MVINKMFDTNYDHNASALKRNLSNLFDINDITIHQWSELIGLDIELTDQIEFLKHIKKLMGFTWADLSAWLRISPQTLKNYRYAYGDQNLTHLSYVQRGFLLYQSREYYRKADIRSTLIHSSIWRNIHYER